MAEKKRFALPPEKRRKLVRIALPILAVLVLLPVLHLLFPDSSVLYSIAYVPLTILWALFYLLCGLLLLLFVLFFINGLHGGYTSSGWKAMGLAFAVCLALLFGLSFLLTKADFVPFSDKSFAGGAFRDLYGGASSRAEADYLYEVRRTDGGKTAEILSYVGEETSVHIPDTLGGGRVTRIGDDAFSGSAVQELVLPDTLEEIGERAFAGCNALSALILPESVTAIGADAFSRCYNLMVFSEYAPEQYAYSPDDCPRTWCTLFEPDEKDTVLFGRYEQDGVEENGEEPIEWLVLDTDGDRQLLLSRYVLDLQAYADGDHDGAWEASAMKPWLNATFSETAFSAEERARIGAEGLFLLTQAQAEALLPENHARVTRMSVSAMLSDGLRERRCDPENGIASWLALNDAGEACLVSEKGTFELIGRLGFDRLQGVRPAVWVTVK